MLVGTSPDPIVANYVEAIISASLEQRIRLEYIAVELEMSTADPKPQQQLYHILGDKRRRYTIHYLKQQGSEVSVTDLAERVAAWENGKSIADLSIQERKRVYISLYQSHLPTLDEKGVIQYDEARKSVGLTPEMTDRKMYLEIVPENSVPSGIYYLGLGIGSGLLLLILSFDLHPVNTVSDLPWASLIVVGLIISSGIHLRQSRRGRLGDAGPPPDCRIN